MILHSANSPYGGMHVPGSVKPSSGNEWFCDPVGGVAFVDGIFLITDSINRRESDRVMPIVKEEQVALCHLLKSRINAGDSVIDVGTGSGVFGIYAARICAARVIAIDVAARSCAFARKNARLNSVDVSSSLAAIAPGKMAIIHQELKRFCRVAPDADVFILNPPFTPTISDDAVAIHARGGYDGQQAFDYQLRTIEPFLTPGKRIIGYQMVCGTPPDFGLKARLSSILRQPFVCELGSAIVGGKSIKARSFLQKIYGIKRTGPRQAARTILADKQIVDHFVGHGVIDKEFSVIAYVITIKKAGRSQFKKMKPALSPLGTWDDRIWLHARILDGIAESIQPASTAFQ